jgi:hypothetical protein
MTMIKEELYNQVLQLMKDSIDSVLNGSVDSVSLWGVCINDVEKYLETTDHPLLSESIDTNGWQVDFWVYTESKKYMLSGSMWYGEMHFSKNEK